MDSRVSDAPAGNARWSDSTRSRSPGLWVSFRASKSPPPPIYLLMGQAFVRLVITSEKMSRTNEREKQLWNIHSSSIESSVLKHSPSIKQGSDSRSYDAPYVGFSSSTAFHRVQFNEVGVFTRRGMCSFSYQSLNSSSGTPGPGSEKTSRNAVGAMTRYDAVGDVPPTSALGVYMLSQWDEGSIPR